MTGQNELFIQGVQMDFPLQVKAGRLEGKVSPVAGSTDMGDITAVMPALHPYISGASGHGHGNDYCISSFDSAVMDSAKVQVRFVELLLENGAARAKEILANFKPVFATKEDYFAAMDAMTSDKDAVIYNEDGTVTLDV